MCTRAIQELLRDKWAITSTPRSIRPVIGNRSILAKETSACVARKAHIKLSASTAKVPPTFISRLHGALRSFGNTRSETCWRRTQKPMLRLAAISGRAPVPAPRSLQWALSFGNEGIALTVFQQTQPRAVSQPKSAPKCVTWARQCCGSKGAYNRPSYPCHYCTYRGGVLRQGAVDKTKADDQRHPGERQHHHVQVGHAVGGTQREIVHDTGLFGGCGGFVWGQLAGVNEKVARS